MVSEQELIAKLAAVRLATTHDSLARCEPLQQLAVHYCNQRRLKRACPLVLELVELQRKGLGDCHPVTITNLKWLASVLISAGDLDRAQSLLEEFIGRITDKTNLPIEQRATLLNQLVELLYQRSRLGDASRRCQQALQLLAQADTSGEAACRQLHRARNNMGALQVAQGEYRAAQRYFIQNLRDAERTLPIGHPLRTTQMANLASLLRLRGRLKQSEQLTIRSIRECQQAHGWFHPLVAQGLSNLGTYRLNTGRPKSAELLFRKALRIHRKLYPAGHIQICRTQRQLADAQRANGRLTVAERVLETTRSTLERKHSSEKLTLAQTLCSIGSVYIAAGRFANAERVLNQAKEIQELALGPKNSQLIQTLNELGRLNSIRGNPATALDCFRRALEIGEARLGIEHSDLATTLIAITDVQLDLGNIEEARQACERALSLRETRLRFRPLLVAEVLIRRCRLALADNQPSHALSIGAKAKRLCSQAKECPPAIMADVLAVAADASRQLNRYRGAEELTLQELSIREQAVGRDHGSLLPTLKRLARIYSERDLFADAQTLLQRALTIAEKTLGALHSTSIDLTEELGRISLNLRNFEEATQWMDRTIKSCQRCYGEDAEEVTRTLLAFSDCLRLADRITDADDYERRAIDLRNRNCHVLL